MSSHCTRSLAVALFICLAAPASALLIQRSVVIDLANTEFRDSANGQREIVTLPRPTFASAEIDVGDELRLEITLLGGRIEMTDTGSGELELVQPFAQGDPSIRLGFSNLTKTLALLDVSGSIVNDRFSQVQDSGAGSCCFGTLAIQDYTDTSLAFGGLVATWTVNSSDGGFPVVFDEMFLRVRADEVRIVPEGRLPLLVLIAVLVMGAASRRRRPLTPPGRARAPADRG